MKDEDGQLVEKKPRKKRTKKQELMMDEEDSEEDCAAMKCLKPTGRYREGWGRLLRGGGDGRKKSIKGEKKEDW